MKLLDQIKSRLPLRQSRTPEPPPKRMTYADVLLARQLAKTVGRPSNNPNDYNRAGRRRWGFRGRAVPIEIRPETETFVPRFVRRHIGDISRIGAQTRRVRRHRARGRAILASYGMGN